MPHDAMRDLVAMAFGHALSAALPETNFAVFCPGDGCIVSQWPIQRGIDQCMVDSHCALTGQQRRTEARDKATLEDEPQSTA